MWKLVNRLMWLMTVVAFAIQIGYWFPRLPAIVPSHFDGQGNVDGQMEKVPFFVLMGLVSAVFLIGFPLLAAGMKKLPNSMINMPNKSHWLAPQRREATVARLGNWLVTVGWLISWLIIGIIQLTCLVAVQVRQTINPEGFVLIGIFVVAIFLMVGWMYWTFRLPESPEQFEQAV